MPPECIFKAYIKCICLSKESAALSIQMFGVEITAGWIQEADARFLFWIYISRLIKTIDSKCSIISQKEVQLFPFPALK